MQRFKILVCSAATVMVLPLAETQAADHPQLNIRQLVRTLRVDASRLYREVRATAFQRPDYKGLLQDADDLTVLAENIERMVCRRANLRLIARDVIEFEGTFQALVQTTKANVIAKKAPVDNRLRNGYIWSDGQYRSPVFPSGRLLVLFDDVDEILFDFKVLLDIKPIPAQQPIETNVRPLPYQPTLKKKNKGTINRKAAPGPPFPKQPAIKKTKQKKSLPPIPVN